MAAGAALQGDEGIGQRVAGAHLYLFVGAVLLGDDGQLGNVGDEVGVLGVRACLAAQLAAAVAAQPLL